MKRIVSLILLLLVLVACNGQPEATATPDVQIADLLPVQRLADELPTDCSSNTFSMTQQANGDLHFVCILDGTPLPTETAVPPTATHVHPTNTPTVTITAVPPDTPTPPATSTPSAPVEPYAGAPKCPPEAHNDRLWHSLWNSQLGCHYTHEHHADPHQLDYLFGTAVYGWMGGEISHPWQTFSGALDSFEHPHADSCLENECKHEGYKWLIIIGRDCSNTPYVTTGANNCITDARVLLHMVFSEQDAIVRFHSIWVEARVCEFGEINCGIYRGGGHLDTGKLNIPRGTYIPLTWNHEPPIWGDPEFAAEAQPYRIHGEPGTSPLDSWNTEGNQYNYLTTDPEGDFRLRVGAGVHVRDGWGGVSPADPDIPLDCPDFQCNQNNSEAALFRVWVTVPDALDGSQYDQDGLENGRFVGSGYTNRYGDIVEGCTEIGLDCIPFESTGVPLGRSRFRGELANTNVEYDISPYWPDGSRDWWIEYPN